MIRYLVLAVELPDDDTDMFPVALQAVNKVAVALRGAGYPSAVADLEGTSPTAYGAQIAAYGRLIETVQQHEI